MSPVTGTPETPNTSTSSTPTLSAIYHPSLQPCSHLSQVLNSNAKDTVLRNYALGVRVSHFNATSVVDLPEYESKNNQFKIDPKKVSRLKSKAVRCKDCKDLVGSSFMCLQCPHIGCWANHHFVHHAKSSGHIFGIDSRLGYLFCFKCGDYTSDSQLEKLRMDIVYSGNPAMIPISNNEKSMKLILQHSRATTFKASTGLRGFVNMGSTCFMSSILQAIIHNPLIRDYFMTEGHMYCPKEKTDCITCCIDEIFTEFYTSDDTTGFGPVSLLNAAWKINRSLAGYSEQDAHEFFQFLVNRLHQDLTQDKLNHQDSSPCKCIIHKTFSSDLQSSITCLECKNVTNTVDPIIDISLEITQSDNLIVCLRNFTKEEKLEVNYNCSNCQKKTSATKRLSLLRFPNVLAIQLKRFKHNNISVKLENFVQFPMFLNMSEFATNNEFDPCLTYELFAIVCHIGSASTGHYVTLVKNNQGQWFKCDDSMITTISLEQVSQVKAYLLFYIVHKL